MSDTWHDSKSKILGCEHCENGKSGGHYFCAEDEPCQDCVDDCLTMAEDIANGYGSHGEDI